MVMTVLVDAHDNVCVSHDNDCQGQPVSVVFDGKNKTLYLITAEGSWNNAEVRSCETRLGRVPLAGIVEKLERASEVRVKQIGLNGEQYEAVSLPLFCKGRKRDGLYGKKAANG